MDQRQDLAVADDNTKIGFTVSGHSGPALLHITAMPWSHALYWHETHDVVRDVLAPRRRFFWVDLRGCGTSSRAVTDFSLDTLVRDLVRVAERAELDTFDLCAEGPCAPIAIRLARQRPDLVQRLVLSHPVLTDSGLFAGLRGLLTEGEFRQYLTLVAMVNQVPQDRLNRIVAYMTRCVDRADLQRFVESFVNWDISGDVGEVEAETLALTYSRPAFSALASSAALIARIPRVDVRVVGEWSDARTRGFEIAAAFLGRGHGPDEAQEPGSRPLVTLSTRECDVLRLLALGRTNAQIAVALFLTASTVATHVRHILEKTGAANRAEAAAWAVRNGLA
jgi:DNA-binding CsgD family transcriptional regulator